MFRSAVARAVGLVALLSLGACSPHVVDSGTIGVRTEWGAVQPEPIAEGLYWRTWFKEGFVNMDSRVVKKESRASASSRDMQVVTSIIALNYRIDPSFAPDIYQGIGDHEAIDANIIDPVLQEAVKTATARYNAEELITKRPEVKAAIRDYVTATLGESKLIVTDLNIVNFEFAAGYQNAIEAKQVAEQQALAATNDLRRIEVEAKQRAAVAQGEADAALIGARVEAERQELLSITISEELIRWQAIQKWDGKLPLVAGEGHASVVDVASLAASR